MSAHNTLAPHFTSATSGRLLTLTVATHSDKHKASYCI